MAASYLTEMQRTIVGELRKEICLADQDDRMILHEADIAQRYGVSRTPIRQVLQYLAQTEMVETQRGYGTVVKPLRTEERVEQMRAYTGICQACAFFLEGRSLEKDVVVELSGLNTWLSLLEERSEEEFVELSWRLINVMSSAIPDEVLRHAYTSLHWRVIRWRVVDIRNDEEFNWNKLDSGLEEASKTAMQRDAAVLFRFAARMGQRHMDPEFRFDQQDGASDNVLPIGNKK